VELPAGRLGDEEDRLVLQRRAAREVSGQVPVAWRRVVCWSTVDGPRVGYQTRLRS